MPNWTINRITCGDKKSFSVISKFLKSDKSEVDFNNIIPMPEGIYMGGINSDVVKEHPLNWYDWSHENWDVKWNASNVSVNEENRIIEFFTPWNDVLGLMGLVARKTKTGFDYYAEYETGEIRECSLDENGRLVSYNEYERSTEDAQH